MSQKHERARHEALARETASWQSWAVDIWFTNGEMALMVNEPFQGPHMRLDFECMCDLSQRRTHQNDLTRFCVFVDTYESDPKIGDRLTAFLKASLQVKGSAFATIDRSVEMENEDGVVSYRVRIDGESDPRAWYAVQKRYIEAVERHARPERWAVLQRPSTPERPVPPVMFALRGKQGVGLIMPMTCPGSGMEAAPAPDESEVTA